MDPHSLAACTKALIEKGSNTMDLFVCSEMKVLSMSDSSNCNCSRALEPQAAVCEKFHLSVELNSFEEHHVRMSKSCLFLHL